MNLLTQKNNACDDSTIDRFLKDLLDQDEQALFEKHLSICEICRDKLDSQAADAPFWSRLGGHLEKDNMSSESSSQLPLDRKVLNSIFLTVQNSILQDSASLEISAISDEATLGQGAVDQLLIQCFEPDSTGSPSSLGCMGKYKVQEIVGRGGMGIVVKAFDRDLKRTVAIKTILHLPATTSSQSERLAREAQAAASLDHEHIIPIYGIDQWRDLPLIVMPFIAGGTLQAYAEQNALTIEQVLKVGIQICEGLTAAHQQGIVHRDIKPSNILLQDELAHVLISDFGLARIEGDHTLTASGVVAGTPQFMSPEQAKGLPLDWRTDLFSLGSVLYWLCTRQYPFQSSTAYGTIFKIANERQTPASNLNPDIPDWLSTLIDRLLEKSADYRMGDATLVRSILEECLLHLRDPGQHSLPLELQSRQSWGRGLTKNQLVFSSLVGIGLIVLSGAYFYWPIHAASEGTKTHAVQTPSSIDSVTKKEYVRFGTMDPEEHIRLFSDLNNRKNADYWLHRLAYLPVSEIPSDIIPIIVEYANHDDEQIRMHAIAILEKNPFQVIDTDAASKEHQGVDEVKSSEAAALNQEIENPFEVIPSLLQSEI